MTVLPRHLLARFLKGELPGLEAEAYGLDVSDRIAPAPIGALLGRYEGDDVEVTEEDRADLKEALLVAVDRGLGDIGRNIVTTLTGLLFDDLGVFQGDDALPGPQPRPRAEADATDPDQPTEDQDPKPPTGARRKTRRRPKTRGAKKSRRR